jgi:hypothetical protein
MFPYNLPHDPLGEVHLILPQGGFRPLIFRILPQILALYLKRLDGFTEGKV